LRAARDLVTMPRVTSFHHTGPVTNFSVPEVPLPLPRNVRAAVVGPDSDFSKAIIEAFSTTDRRVDHIMPQQLSSARMPLSRSYDVIFLTVEPSSLEDVLSGHAKLLSELVVVVCTSSVSRDENGFFMNSVTDGSVTNLVARLLPGSRIVGALQQFNAEHLTLGGLGALESDVPVVSDDIEAADLIEGIIDEIPGFDSVYAGSLRSSAAIEGLAAVISEASREFGGSVGFRLSQAGIKILDR
jgi:predicted dinucleotide-binding enzyme